MYVSYSVILRVSICLYHGFVVGAPLLVTHETPKAFVNINMLAKSVMLTPKFKKVPLIDVYNTYGSSHITLQQPIATARPTRLFF